MADYKNTENGVFRYADSAYIPSEPENKDYQEYLEYVAGGGATDPWKTTEELFDLALADKLQELRAERNSQVDAAVGTSDPRRKDRIISRSVKLVRRELKGTATSEEEAELNTMEALDNHLDDLDSEHDAAEQWLNDPARTIEQLQAYNVATDPGWSVLA